MFILANNDNETIVLNKGYVKMFKVVRNKVIALMDNGTECVVRVCENHEDAEEKMMDMYYSIQSEAHGYH